VEVAAEMGVGMEVEVEVEVPVGVDVQVVPDTMLYGVATMWASSTAGRM
jgi:hypothetical protein